MRTVTPLILFTTLPLTSSAGADILVQNSTSAAGNAAAEAAWLASIGIGSSEVQFREDFESGFVLGQNISGVSGLLPGGLVLTDTSSADSLTIQNATNWFGGSNPVGTFSVSHNEAQWFELDFSAQPVDYFAFADIDQAGAMVRVHHQDGSLSTFSLETTASGGNSAEFVGVYRNDTPPIVRVEIDASGDGRWGVDTLQYGSLPASAFCTANANSTGSAGVLTASGSAIASSNQVQLVAWSLPPNQFGYFLNSMTQGFNPGAGGSQGNLCLAGAIGRYNGAGQVQNSGTGGVIALELDLASTPTPSGAVSIAAGQTWSFQCWYRDANPGPASNFTQGLEIAFL